MDVRKSVLCLLLLSYLPCFICEETKECEEIRNRSYLDVAVNMIKTVIDTKLTCPKAQLEATDCSDVMRNGFNVSGVYYVFPKSRVINGETVKVYCDMDTEGGGWTLIQRRGNFLRLKDYFFKDWNAYKNGFGDIEKDFWLGNDNIFALSNQKMYSIRFDLEDVQGNRRYALYEDFWIDDEPHKYTLHIKDYSGDAEDAMTPDHEGQDFSTKDRDNDKAGHENCAEVYKGGWWYKACHAANLNGLYIPGIHKSFADGMIWFHWKGHHESMKTTEIKIRPKGFRPEARALLPHGYPGPVPKAPPILGAPKLNF